MTSAHLSCHQLTVDLVHFLNNELLITLLFTLLMELYISGDQTIVLSHVCRSKELLLVLIVTHQSIVNHFHVSKNSKFQIEAKYSIYLLKMSFRAKALHLAML